MSDVSLKQPDGDTRTKRARNVADGGDDYPEYAVCPTCEGDACSDCMEGVVLTDEGVKRADDWGLFAFVMTFYEWSGDPIEAEEPVEGGEGVELEGTCPDCEGGGWTLDGDECVRCETAGIIPYSYAMRILKHADYWIDFYAHVRPTWYRETANAVEALGAEDVREKWS